MLSELKKEYLPDSPRVRFVRTLDSYFSYEDYDGETVAGGEEGAIIDFNALELMKRRLNHEEEHLFWINIQDCIQHQEYLVMFTTCLRKISPVFLEYLTEQEGIYAQEAQREL